MRELKKILIICFTLLLFSISSTVYAADKIDLDLTIPDAHIVSLTCNDGSIVVDNSICGSEVSIQRHKEQVYWIIPNAGKVLSSLTYDGVDVKDKVTNGVFIADKLVRDAVLVVTFVDSPPAPDDKKYDIIGKLEGEGITDKEGIVVEIGGKKGVTDKDGNFVVKDVPSGASKITFTDKDGKVIGYGDIDIKKATGDTFSSNAKEHTISPANTTTQIGATFVLLADGMVDMKDISDQTPIPTSTTTPEIEEEEPPENPQGNPSGNSTSTGDSNTNLVLYIGLFSISLFGMILWGKKMKKVSKKG